MRKITAFFLFVTALLFWHIGFAQENKKSPANRTWPEPGAKWYYSYVNFSTTGYVHIECSGDTTLIDVSTSREYQNCKILSKSRYTFDFISGNYNSESLGNEYIWSNEDSVLIYRHNKFYLLYNFSAEIGDEWTIPETYYSGCDTIGRIVVTGKGDTLIHSEMLRYIDVIPKESSKWSIRGKVIEKIGPIEWYMLPETEGCIADLFEGGIFRCFQDGLFEYQSGITPYCDYIVSTPENISEKLINIYPNPANNWVSFAYTLEGGQAQAVLELRDAAGKTVHQVQLSQPKGAYLWDTRELQPGSYYYSLKTANTTKTGKVVISK